MRVKTPDGKIAEFPDGMPPEQVQAILAKQFGGAKEPTFLARMESKIPGMGSPEDVMAKREHPQQSGINALPWVMPWSKATGAAGLGMRAAQGAGLSGAQSLMSGGTLADAGKSALLGGALQVGGE